MKPKRPQRPRGQSTEEVLALAARGKDLRQIADAMLVTDSHPSMTLKNAFRRGKVAEPHPNWVPAVRRIWDRNAPKPAGNRAAESGQEGAPVRFEEPTHMAHHRLKFPNAGSELAYYRGFYDAVRMLNREPHDENDRRGARAE